MINRLLPNSAKCQSLICGFLSTATVEDDSDVGGLKLGGYEKHQQKLRQERKEDYRKYLAEVSCEKEAENIYRQLKIISTRLIV